MNDDTKPTIQRYDLCGGYYEPYMAPMSDGDYYLADDVKAELDRLAAKVEQQQAAIERLEKQRGIQCPQCGGDVVLYRQNLIRCGQCGAYLKAKPCEAPPAQAAAMGE